MSRVQTNYYFWDFGNFLDPNASDSTLSSFVVRGTPSTSSIKFSIRNEAIGVDQWIELTGIFPTNSARTVHTAFDLLASEARVTSCRTFIGTTLVVETIYAPEIQFNRSGFSFTEAGVLTEFSGDDVFIGSTDTSSKGDVVYGYSGDDLFYPNYDSENTSDIVNGGIGTDTSVYRGKRNEYILSRANNLSDPTTNSKNLVGFRITDSVIGRDGDDELISIERLAFSDKSLALDTDGVAGQAYRIYKAAFNRTPDPGGLGYWIARMDKGMDVVTVAARFIDSGEFRSLYGQNPTNAEFLTKIYNNVLARSPDEAGLAWWMNEMTINSNKSWEKILADFSESTENRVNVASLIASGITYESWVG
jgi:hypothetical protein